MAILGYSTRGSSGPDLFVTGLMYVTKFNLASPLTMTELHGWFKQGASASTVRVVIYADTAGSPAALVAYTSALSLGTGSANVEVSETGFNIALPAADYWIGWTGAPGGGSPGGGWGDAAANVLKGSTVATYPPQDPFPAISVNTTYKLSCWAVVDVAPTSTFVPQIIIG